MSYIGSVPTTASFPFDQFSGNGSTTAFTLTYAPASTTSIIVAISGVVQNPNLYSIVGNTLTFSPAPPSGTNNISVLYLGLPVQIGTPIPGSRLELALGSAANPSLTFLGDTNTGIYSPAADTVAFSTNGTERLKLDDSGDIDMAATSSLQKNGTNAYALKDITYLTSGTGATYTTPTGVRAIYVECVGGGGGGGGVDGQGAGTGAGGGGGGGGGYVAKLITSPSASYTYTIGAGGAGGAAGANNGTGGGDTTFTDGTLTLTADGALAGAGITAASSNAYYNLTAGGNGSGGDIVIGGLRGGARSRGNFVQYYGGYGGASVFGTGTGGAGGEDAAGTAGTRYGAGGGGGGVVAIATNYAGGAGFQGVIRITEYY
jgi:hypothetical protein